MPVPQACATHPCLRCTPHSNLVHSNPWFDSHPWVHSTLALGRRQPHSCRTRIRRRGNAISCRGGVKDPSLVSQISFGPVVQRLALWILTPAIAVQIRAGPRAPVRRLPYVTSRADGGAMEIRLDCAAYRSDLHWVPGELSSSLSTWQLVRLRYYNSSQKMLLHFGLSRRTCLLSTGMCVFRQREGHGHN